MFSVFQLHTRIKWETYTFFFKMTSRKWSRGCAGLRVPTPTPPSRDAPQGAVARAFGSPNHRELRKGVAIAQLGLEVVPPG